MTTIIIGLTALLYGIALFLWVRQRSYRYVIALVAGHATALFIPLWNHLYEQQYSIVDPALSVFGRAIPLWLVLGSAWLTSLPTLLLFYAQRMRWWPRHYVAGLAAFVAMIMYHLILQGLAARTRLWVYVDMAAQWGLLYQLFMAILGALISFIGLYALVATRHYAAEIAIPALTASVVAAPLLVYGVLGAPFWLASLINPQTWMVRGGIAVTVLLVVWIVHLLCWGLHASRKQQVRWG